MAGGRPGPVRVGAGLGALLCALHVQAACRVTTVTQELLKEGFHRDLLVKVELGEDAGGCAVAAQVHLPPGLYVDPYELATLQQHNLTKAYEESMLRVPVGLREHNSLVCALTLLTTGLCSGLILAAACKYGHFSQ
ncbi:phosphatidylinositol-glycan biosynthesis class X protein isoform 2-T2 [Geothlypis trichas]